MPDTIHHIRHWSRHRQCLGRRGESAAEVLKATTGVYSTHPSGPLSLFARVKHFTEEDFRRIDAQKLGLRVPAMRESVYLLPRETAHRTMAASIPPPGDPNWARRYSQSGRKIPPEFFDEWKEEILRVAQAPMAASELKKQARMPDDKLKFVLNRMAFEGYLLRIGADSLRSNIISYVSTEAWLGEPFPPEETAKAQAWLAERYLHAFGPARIQDFQWWVGITKTAAVKATDAVDVVDVGEGHLLPASQIQAYESFKPPKTDTVDLLPQWDSYTMGYAPDGRDRLSSRDTLERIYGKLGATGGNAFGVILVNGLARAVWKPKFSGSKMQVELDAFEKFPDKTMDKVTEEFQKIALFLSAKDLQLK
ncbi:MAG: winged helix DNA-binding domain-containing protein [Lewinellaceae bacterium]|nr:winged helix DNA-binding domain-containing protein [Lewinellaceae bacterium]